MSASHKTPLRFPVPDATEGNPYTSRLIIRKSVFLASSCHCPTVEAAREFIGATRSIYTDATHNCWAFVAGPPSDTARIGSSDDGEPHGTAGRPILEALLHGGVGEICMVVTRWFGGIKLGTGGLSRAYRDSALENIRTLPLRSRIPLCRCRLELEYSFLDSLRRLMAEFEAVIISQDYLDIVRLVADVPADRLEDFRQAVGFIANGRVALADIAPTGPAG